MALTQLRPEEYEKEPPKAAPASKKSKKLTPEEEAAAALKQLQEQAAKEAQKAQKEAQKQALEIATNYGLTYDCGYRSMISFDSSYLVDADECKAQRDREHARYEKQKKAMQEIEVNCTLGADREEFMKMLAEVSF